MCVRLNLLLCLQSCRLNVIIIGSGCKLHVQTLTMSSMKIYFNACDINSAMNVNVNSQVRMKMIRLYCVLTSLALQQAVYLPYQPYLPLLCLHCSRQKSILSAAAMAHELFLHCIHYHITCMWCFTIPPVSGISLSFVEWSTTSSPLQGLESAECSNIFILELVLACLQSQSLGGRIIWFVTQSMKTTWFIGSSMMNACTNKKLLSLVCMHQ